MIRLEMKPSCKYKKWNKIVFTIPLINVQIEISMSVTQITKNGIGQCACDNNPIRCNSKQSKAKKTFLRFY